MACDTLYLQSAPKECDLNNYVYQHSLREVVSSKNADCINLR